jgi:hydroxysqualene synthase
MTTRPADLSAAYAHCAEQVRGHYENFPVASRLLPEPVREAVAVIYAFARAADDFADEGNLAPPARLAALNDWEAKLHSAAAGVPPDHPVFVALADVLKRHRLPVSLFRDLIEAFRMDVRQNRWPDFPSLLEYCRHSANPVGRLLLLLHGEPDERDLEQSDSICTALQLINFWQDLGQDMAENDRIYVPQDDMARYGVTVEQLRERRIDDKLCELMRFQRYRAGEMMREGAPLAKRTPGRFGFELRLVVQGGLRILDHLDTAENDPFARPRLGRADWALVALRAIRG